MLTVIDLIILFKVEGKQNCTYHDVLQHFFAFAAGEVKGVHIAST